MPQKLESEKWDIVSGPGPTEEDHTRRVDHNGPSAATPYVVISQSALGLVSNATISQAGYPLVFVETKIETERKNIGYGAHNGCSQPSKTRAALTTCPRR